MTENQIEPCPEVAPIEDKNEVQSVEQAEEEHEPVVIVQPTFEEVEAGVKNVIPIPAATHITKVPLDLCPEHKVPRCYCKICNYKHETDEIPIDGNFEIPKTADVTKPPPPKKGKQQQITITIKARNKKKSTTTISGISLFGGDVKEISKLISKKIATAAATKEKAGETVIVVQGDASDQIKNIIKTALKIPATSIQVVKKVKQPKPITPVPPPQNRNFE